MRSFSIAAPGIPVLAAIGVASTLTIAVLALTAS
jgi:hypothetical protein